MSTPHLLARVLFGTLALAAFACTAPVAPGDGAATPQAPPTAEPNMASAPNTVTAPTSAGSPNTTPAPTSTPVATPGAAVRYIGRIDSSTDPRGPILSWPGTQIVVGFTGTQLSVALDEMDTTTYGGMSQDNAFAVTVDGAPGARITLSHATSNYLVASNLASGQHTVVLTKLTEGQVGRVQHLGSTANGNLTFTPAVSARRIEFVGDSGTAGYGVDGNFPCSYTAATADAALAYPALVGNLLAAEVHNISFSGKGLVQNRDMVNDAEKTLPVLWGRTLPNDENVLTYNPKLWQPQAVVMTIGGNDFYTAILPQSDFVAKVTGFISTVRAAYPNVHVFLGVSPMLRNDAWPNERDSGLTYAQAIVQASASDHVHYLNLPADSGNNGVGVSCNPNMCYGCDQHMSPATHRLEATTIVAAIRAVLGW